MAKAVRAFLFIGVSIQVRSEKIAVVTNDVFVVSHGKIPVA
jgi:hypothetical protein